MKGFESGRRRFQIWGKRVLFFCLFLALPLEVAAISREDLFLPHNSVFLDRNGAILRFLPDEKGLRHLWVEGEKIPLVVKQAFIAAEDKGFYDHSGFNLLAILRALKTNLLKGRIVSGGSTITQQLVRLLHPRSRTYGAKLKEIVKSAEIERLLSKEEILEQYLNRVPMGNQMIGIGIASRFYFGKEVGELSAAEAALLASLPKAPEMLNPYGPNVEKLLARKNWVLERMASQGYLTKEELKRAIDQEILFRERTPFPHEAPHFVDLLIARGKNRPGAHRTTLDLTLQRRVEKILRSHRSRLALKGAHQAALLVVHNPTMEVLAYAGSISHSPRHQGYNNGVIAFRSAGSTFKPFLYGLALEQGLTVSSLLEDTLRKYRTPNGNYTPENYDRREYGPVTLRSALGNSLNISAIRMMENLDQESAFETLKRSRLVSDSKRGVEYYGLGLAIGNPEVSLERLVSAYAMLANSGLYRPLRYLLDDETEKGERIFSKEVAYILTDILSDPSARMVTFGTASQMSFSFKVALKTGTSTHYRDGWIVGYTPEYTVGVWVGNFEGTSTAKVSGATGAAPILWEIMNLLHENGPPSEITAPETVIRESICGISGMKPGPSCRYITRELFIKGTEPRETCPFHAGEALYHELPPNYAGWLHAKAQRGLEGAYRLSGFSSRLEEVFREEPPFPPFPEAPAGIRILSPLQKRSEGEDEAHLTWMALDRGNEDGVELLRGEPNRPTHYSIGKMEDSPRRVGPGRPIAIAYPLPGDRFVLGRGEVPKLIRLEAIASRPLPYVDWFIDGLHFARARPPYHAYWNLERGKHNLTVVSPDRQGESIEIVVE